MLEINPLFRPTASQLLENKIFDGVRVTENEKIEPMGKIKISIDTNLFKFDYENEKLAHDEE